MKHNGKNERIKRAYYVYLKEAKRQSPASVEAAAAAIDRFEGYAKRRDFAAFHISQATAFKTHLGEQLNERTKKPLSKSTQLHTLAALRSFFIWLADQRGYPHRYSDADYFNLSLKYTAIARTERGIEGPTIEQVRHVVQQMPNGTDIEKRNRALIALALLTVARDDALASLQLKHLDIANRLLRQDARDVRTKASKTIDTWFFPAGEDFVRIVEDYVIFLQSERHWGLNDPLFPATRMGHNSVLQWEASGFQRECWSNASPIRRIFREAFAVAGLPYFNPHSLRKTITRLGQELCTTPEEFKAWSQNLGHENVLTTFTSYGQIGSHRQRDIIRSLGEANILDTESAALLRDFEELVRKRTKHRV